jgi:serine/threonine protein kinase
LNAAGITHRDIKPGNLVLDRQTADRTVLKLVDFGIAKENADEPSRALDTMVGTPRYMAPEQIRGENIDARCDLYALGATLYQMLTGRTPHTGDTVDEIVDAALHAAITPVAELRSDCPAGLARIVMKALARDPAQRFASAREMKRALERWQAGQRDDPLEDTLRICTLQSASLRKRRRLPRHSLLALGALVLGVLWLSQASPRPSHRELLSRQVTAQVQAAELSALDRTQQAGEVASALALQTSTFARELLTHARSSAYELLEGVARHARAGTSPGASTPDR